MLLKGIGVLLISVILPALVLLFELNILRTGFDFLAALVLMNFGLIFTPILIVISIGSYFLSKKLLRVSQMNHLFLIVPIFLSIISPNTLLIYWQVISYRYASEYKSFNPVVKLSENNFVANDDLDLFVADYYYKLNFSNPTSKTYKDVPIIVVLTDKLKELGVNTQNKDILPGSNTIEGKILVDSNMFKTGYIPKNKLFLKLSYTLPNPPQIQFLEIGNQGYVKFKEILQKLEKRQKILNAPLPNAPPEIIGKTSPPSNWKKYQGPGVSFFYPPVWRTEIKENTPSGESATFYATIPGISSELNVFEYLKTKEPLLSRLEEWKKTDLLDDKEDIVTSNIQADDKSGAKLAFLNSEVIIVLFQEGKSTHELHIQYLPEQSAKETLNQILATVEFVK